MRVAASSSCRKFWRIPRIAELVAEIGDNVPYSDELRYKKSTIENIAYETLPNENHAL